MTTQDTTRGLFTVLVWDYDDAPDGDGYYLWKRVQYYELDLAVRRANIEYDEHCATGARVYRWNKEVYTIGFIPE